MSVPLRSMWWTPGSRLQHAAKRVVEIETLRYWCMEINEPPNPFDPRLGHDAALANCQPHTDTYYNKALWESDGEQLAEHVSRNLPSVVSAILNDRKRVMNSTLRCAKVVEDKATGEKEVRAHHCASGYKISARLSPDGIFANKVSAKPYAGRGVPCSHCWKSPDQSAFFWWERHLFLGIGTRIYNIADKKAGGRRWVSGGTSPYSAPLRRKLHWADPFKWEDRDCEVCAKMGTSWEETPPDGFLPHQSDDR